MEQGIDVDEKTASEMVELCYALGMDVREYLGDEASGIPYVKSEYKA